MKNVLEAKQRQNQLFEQQENSDILRTVNWAAELDTDTIATSTWTLETTGATLADEANTTTTASARISGYPGKHLITNKITTAAGNTMERQIIIKVYANDMRLVSHYNG